MVEIVQRVGRNAEFRIDDQIDPRRVGPFRLLQNGIPIEAHIGGAHARRAGGHPDEAMTVHRKKMLGTGAISAHSSILSIILIATFRHSSLTGPRPIAP